MFSKQRTRYEYDRLRLPQRPAKPRDRGLTVLIDAGPSDFGWTGPRALRDLLDYGCEFIDYAKLYALNGLLYPVELIREVTKIYREYDVKPFCGGILFEAAYRGLATKRTCWNTV